MKTSLVLLTALTGLAVGSPSASCQETLLTIEPTAKQPRSSPWQWLSSRMRWRHEDCQGLRCAVLQCWPAK